MLAFSPVVRIGNPPPPHPQARLSPPGQDTLACGRGGGGSQFRRGDRHCGTLGIYVLCGSVADPEPDSEGSETFGRIRSGTEINVSDPDSNPDPKLDPKKTVKRSLIFWLNKVVASAFMLIHISHLQVVATIAVQ